jgi:hypothetical protein
MLGVGIWTLFSIFSFCILPPASNGTLTAIEFGSITPLAAGCWKPINLNYVEFL